MPALGPRGRCQAKARREASRREGPFDISSLDLGRVCMVGDCGAGPGAFLEAVISDGICESVEALPACRARSIQVVWAPSGAQKFRLN